MPLVSTEKVTPSSAAAFFGHARDGTHAFFKRPTCPSHTDISALSGFILLGFIDCLEPVPGTDWHFAALERVHEPDAFRNEAFDLIEFLNGLGFYPDIHI